MMDRVSTLLLGIRMSLFFSGYLQSGPEITWTISRVVQGLIEVVFLAPLVCLQQ